MNAIKALSRNIMLTMWDTLIRPNTWVFWRCITCVTVIPIVILIIYNMRFCHEGQVVVYFSKQAIKESQRDANRFTLHRVSLLKIYAMDCPRRKILDDNSLFYHDTYKREKRQYENTFIHGIS